MAGELGPAGQRMFGWIEEVVARGVRRPGYPADQWTEQWAAARFDELGLHDVRLEPVTLPRWDPIRADVTLLPDGPNLSGFALPHTVAGTVEGDLVRLDDPAADVAGALAVDELTLSRLPQTVARAMATTAHDPDDDFAWLEQVLPFGARFQAVMEPALDRDAAGFVGLLTGLGWESCDYYVPYDGVLRPIPGLWLSTSDGDTVLEAMASGPVQARLTVQSERQMVTTHNVVGVLPGASDEWVVIASHHDAPWASAVEDGSGIALVLGQAAHWASVSEEARPHNLLFLLTSGHMVHAAGTAAFIDGHRDLLQSVVLEVHLEHAARRCVPRDGTLIPTDEPEVRWWFTSRNAQLEEAVHGALVAHDLRRSLVLPPNVFFETPPTDGAFFHTEGVPLVHFLTAPMYLFDSCDTLDKIHEASLEPVTAAVVDIVTSTRGVSAAEMRSGVVGPDTGPT